MNERATKNSSSGISMPVSGSGWSEGVTKLQRGANTSASQTVVQD